MNDTERLRLIGEAIRYCQRLRRRVRPAVYMPALTAAIHFLWELRKEKSKWRAAKYRSKGAAGLEPGKGKLVYDHAIPLKYCREHLLSLPTRSVTPAKIRAVLDRCNPYAVLITRKEDRLLASAKLKQKMPDERRGSNPCKDPRSRYNKVAIKLVPNNRAKGQASIP